MRRNKLKIKEIFAKPIDRNIKGVITIGDEQDANIKQELEEYVVTKELQQHFQEFFSAYTDSINQDTTKMGVWISGFFGSGKSHFLKILAYLLENREVAGKPAIDYFLDDQKLSNPNTITNLQAAASIHNETILFNIDSKAKNGNKSQKDAILNVFLQVFNEQLGLIGVDFWIADMERDLIQDDQYTEFQEKFQELDKQHRTWLDARNGFAFLKGTIKDALVAIGYMTEENATGFIEQLKTNYPISVENFAERVNDYIVKQDPNYHLVFLVDEVGQYIGNSQQRMLNLQSVVEDLGTYTHGKAWVIVTSQQAIDQVTDNINGQDFSKIQGRFNTRIAMSSANVDEVINKRLLTKTVESEQSLANIYDNDQHAINNLITFEADIDRDHYRSPQNFADVYPFVPYQFNLLQDTLTAIRKNGSDGKHLANGERSMLAVFQESAQRLEQQDVRSLVPFSLFFQGLDQFLDHTHMIVIRRALDNDVINPEHQDHPFAVQVLETLFMVKYLANFKTTLNNVTTLMIDSIDTDRIKLEKQVKDAMTVLISQKVVEKTTNGFEFLTDAEQDVSRQINKQSVDGNEISREIGEYLFSNNQINGRFVYPKLDRQYSFKFNQFVDGHPHGVANNTMSIKINTPESDTNHVEMELRRIALSPTDPQIIIDMPADGQYIDDVRQALQIGKFLRDTSNRKDDARSEKIIDVKRLERQTLNKKSQSELEAALEDADIYVGDERLEANSKSFEKRLSMAQVHLIDEVYRNLSFIDVVKSETDIVKLFKSDFELVDTDENKQAIQAVLDRINRDYRSPSKISYKALLERFIAAPYGYRDWDVKWIIAKLFVGAQIKAYVNGEQINLSSDKTSNKIADFFTMKQYTDKLQLVPRVAVSDTQKRDLKEVAREVFNKNFFDNDEDDTLVQELRHTIDNANQLLTRQLGLSNRYPGRNILENGQALLKQLLSRQDTDAFYALISAKKNDLLDWHDDMYDDGLEDFYNSADQKHIWDDALSKVDIYEKSRSFISGNEVPDSYHKIKTIVDSNKPQGNLNDLKRYNEAFNEVYNNEFDKIETDVEQVVNDEWQATLTYIQAKAVPTALETEINHDFEHFIAEAKVAANLDELVIIKSKAGVRKDRFLTRADQVIAENEQQAARLAAKNQANEKAISDSNDQEEAKINKIETNATTPTAGNSSKANIPMVKHISLSSLPVSRTWQLTSDKDIDTQLAQLRAALVAQLAEVDQIKLNL
ncbi:BREX system P-loop protein BrxC [Lactobacillus sp. CBA3605]|nr:BREX system P-loop protein BrxC [Lactobacillus sp. CBA3605]